MFFPSIQETCEKVYHCDVVIGIYSPKNKSVVIDRLISREPNKGNATKCMKYLINALERYGVLTIYIVAMPVPGTTGPDAETLIKWYQKFGFVVAHYTNVGCQIFSAEMELNFLPPKLVVLQDWTNHLGSPETSTGKGLQLPTVQGGSNHGTLRL